MGLKFGCSEKIIFMGTEELDFSQPRRNLSPLKKKLSSSVWPREVHKFAGAQFVYL